MLHFNRIDVSEGIDVKKTSVSKECDICHYWYFLNKGFEPLAILLFKVHIRSADYRY